MSNRLFPVLVNITSLQVSRINGLGESAMVISVILITDFS